MIKSQIQSISLFEAIDKSDYQENVKNILASLFFDHFSNNQNHIYLLTKKIDHSEMTTNIFVLHHKVRIPVQGKMYDVPLLIFLPDSFPFGMPELYIERRSNIVINQKLPQGLISNYDLRIHYEYYKKWPKEANGLLEVLGYLYKIFTRAFPVYSSKKETEYNGNCIFDYNHSILVKLDQAYPDNNSKISEMSISKASTNISRTPNDITSVTPGNNLLEIDTPQGNEEEMKNEQMLSDEELQSQLKDDLKAKLSKSLELKQKRMKENKENLLKTKRELEEKIKKINEVCTKEAEIMGIVNNLTNELDQALMNIPLSGANSEELLIMPINKRCLFMLDIKNPKTFCRLVAELTIEEMLPMYRKLYEKSQISFEEAIKSIRIQSSKLFKMKEAQRRNANI